MISKVRSVIDLIAVYLGTNGVKFPIVRKEQSANKQVYPFGAYKVLSINGTNYDNKENITNNNPVKITERYSKIETAVVSLSFYVSENSGIDSIYALAEKAIDYLQRIGLDAFIGLNLYVELLNSSVTDRTTYLDPVYEYQIGFDFKVKIVKELDVVLDTINIPLSVEAIEIELL